MVIGRVASRTDPTIHLKVMLLPIPFIINSPLPLGTDSTQIEEPSILFLPWSL